MKKSLVSFIIPLAIFTLAVVVVGPVNTQAQTFECPVGYICTILGPRITNISPTTGQAGTVVTIVGENFDLIKNEIRLSCPSYGGGIGEYTSSTDGKTLSFVTSSLPIQEGINITYPLSCNISVINSNGTSNGVSFTVTDSTKPTTPLITVVKPNGGENYLPMDRIDFSAQVNYSPKQLVAYLYSPVNGNVIEQTPSIDLKGNIVGGFVGDPSIGAGQYRITVCDLLTDNPNAPGKSLCDSSDEYFTVSSSPTTPCYTFTMNLQLGDGGPRDPKRAEVVIALQNFLIGKGFKIADLKFEGRKDKGYFGGSTFQALKKYQKSVGIDPTGYFGPETRAKANADCTKVSDGYKTVEFPATKASYYITSLAYKESYKTGESISFRYLKGIETTNGISVATPEEGFNVQVYVYDANDLNPKASLDGINATYDYDTSTWHGKFSKILPDGLYRVEWFLYCSNSAKSCGQYDKGYQSVVSLKVKVGEIKDPIQPSIQVISPNGGENWTTGRTQTIKWSASEFPSGSTIYIELKPDNFNVGSVSKIAVVLPFNGYYSWTIPKDITPGLYNIEMYMADANGNIDPDEATKDISDKPFTIQSIPTVDKPTRPLILSVTNASVSLGTLIKGTDRTITYPMTFKFALNAGDRDIYVSRTSLVQTSVSTNIGFSYKDPAANPSSLGGDTNDSYIIPARSSRTFTLYGAAFRYGTVGTASVKIDQINYGVTADNTNSNHLTAGLSNLKLSFEISGDQSTGTKSTKPTISSFSADPATVSGGQSSTLKWSVQNVDYCILSSDNAAVSPAFDITGSGSRSTGPLHVTTKSRLDCGMSGTNMETTSYVTVTVGPVALEPASTASIWMALSKLLGIY